MSERKLTKWELGQELVALSDFMHNQIDELSRSNEDGLASKLNELRAKVGDLFNENNDHDFGIYDSETRKSSGILKQGRV